MHIKGVVLNDYIPPVKSKGSTNFLEVSQEEIVIVKEQHNSGWYFCESYDGSEKGWIPKKNINLSSPLKAISDFQSASEDELSMREGEVLFGLNLENDWWYGLKNDLGGIGWFPSSYVVNANEFTRIYTNTGLSPSIILTQSDESSPKASKGKPQEISKRKSFRDNFNFNNPLQGRFQSNRASQRLDPNDIQLSVKTGPNNKLNKVHDRQQKKLTTTSILKNPVGKPPKDCLVYAYWGHNMGLATAMTLILTGPFACMWTKIEGYSCVIDGKQIASEYILGQGNDASCTDATTGVVYCCDPARGLIDAGQHASNFVGVYSIIIGILFLILKI